MEDHYQQENAETVRVISRSVRGHRALLRLSDGNTPSLRRYFPAGEQDELRINGDSIQVFVRNDATWIEVGIPWEKQTKINLGGISTKLTFKEIETDEEAELFEELRKFHYRGGGGAGRTVPLIAKSDLWDMPSVLGFVEIASSMIANTARKRFLDFPYSEPEGISWRSWNRDVTKKYSNIICRISRFVIHPEIRGLGLAKYFSAAAREYAAERWHYGGYRARFLEITADMLRYYPFVDRSFFSMGETEGNEHRLAQDMTYLIKKARSADGAKGMPQGGGGIMTLQRGYANTLLDYLKQNERSLPEVISSLRHDASALDQETWEALHRLNRRPKPSFVAGVSPVAAAYVKVRSDTFAGHSNMRSSPKVRIWNIDDIEIAASAKMAQTQDARLLQDAFGFVGAEMNATIVSQLSLHIASGEISIVCGGSGAGKSVLLSALTSILGGTANKEAQPTQASKCAHIEISGRSDHVAKVGELPTFTATSIPLELRGRASLEDFIKVCSKCGLAEPQMFVRPTSSLSSGQRYRLQIALAFLAKPDVLLIDNFCEPLDRYTALAVCRGIRQMARELNIAVVVATAAYERLLGLIEVEQSILLRRGDKPIVKRGSSDEIPKGDIRLKVSNQGPEYAKH